VVRACDDSPGPKGDEIIGHLHSDDSATQLAAAETLNTFDVVIVQHDFGAYGGPDGDQLLAVLERLRVPVLTVAHAVPATPTTGQALVLQRVVDASDAVVTVTNVARDRLVGQYDIDPDRAKVVPHGATLRSSPYIPDPTRAPVILTWGLLRPGKGLEWAVDGLRRLIRLRPAPTYIVAGQTHPSVRRQQGETYRLHLKQRAAANRVAGMLQVAGAYLSEDELTRLIDRADVVLLPYDARDQVTSGVLAEAVAAGKPVVATAFPHAVELLSSGAGLLVPQYDAVAIGDALYRVLTEPDLAQRMRAEAARIAPSLDWSAVGEQYLAVASELITNPSPIRG
jgi:glycosyltransferase involved in cell wall biosynthesis